MDITGNTILITGASSGIGRALAERLHQRGNTVIITGRRKELLDDIARRHPGMRAIAADLQAEADVRALATRLQSEFPALNVVFNNAGIMQPERLSAGGFDMAAVRSTIETNVISVIALTSAVLPHLLKQPRATVAATTSGLASMPLAMFPTYCGTKAFLHSWLQSLRYQLKGTQVEVLEIAPPYVQTELTGSHQASDPNAMPLAEYADEVMKILASPPYPEGEILVERVKPLRYAERTGQYQKVFEGLNAMRFE